MTITVFVVAVVVSFALGAAAGWHRFGERLGTKKARDDLAAAMTGAVTTTAVMEIRENGLRIVSTHYVNGESFKVEATFNAADADRFVDVWTKRRKAA